MMKLRRWAFQHNKYFFVNANNQTRPAEMYLFFNLLYFYGKYLLLNRAFFFLFGALISSSLCRCWFYRAEIAWNRSFYKCLSVALRMNFIFCLLISILWRHQNHLKSNWSVWVYQAVALGIFSSLKGYNEIAKKKQRMLHQVFSVFSSSVYLCTQNQTNMHTQNARKHKQHENDDLAHLFLCKMNSSNDCCTKSIVEIFKVTFCQQIMEIGN